MPRSDKYSGDSGKHSGAPSGGSTGLPSVDGGVDSGASDRVVFSAAPEAPYSYQLAQQLLTVFERENLNSPLPGDPYGAIDSESFKGSCADESNIRSKGSNETYPGGQSGSFRDFSKGHGAAPPAHLNPEVDRV